MTKSDLPGLASIKCCTGDYDLFCERQVVGTLKLTKADSNASALSHPLAVRDKDVTDGVIGFMVLQKVLSQRTTERHTRPN